MALSEDDIDREAKQLINDCLSVLGVREDDKALIEAARQRCSQLAIPAAVAAGGLAGAKVATIPGIGTVSAIVVAIVTGAATHKANRLYCESILLPILRKAREELWQDPIRREEVSAELARVIAHQKRAV